MNPDIRYMFGLQEVDLKILSLQKELEKIPLLEQDIQKELENLQQLTVDADAEVRELEKSIRDQEGEVEELRSRRLRLKQQQLEVKNNKEYQAILAEIDFLEREISSREDSILEKMERSETAKQTAQSNKLRLAADSTRLHAEQQRLADSTAFLSGEIQTLKTRREDTARDVPSRLLALYNRLSNGLGGIALAEARDEICQVCHVRLRPQIYQELRTTETIFQCENCSRILYHQGD